MKTFIRVLLTCCTAAFCAFALPSSAADKIIPEGVNGSGKEPVVPETPAPAEPVPAPDSASSGHSVPVSLYMQHDPSWANYLYGGRDPMAAYGCGPTALAIAVSALSDTPLSPVDAAKWSAANGHYSQGRGSVHSLIPSGALNYGLKVEKLSSPDPDSFRLILSVDKLLVLLMGPGDFSDSGHFIVVYGYNNEGKLLIADPASAQRSATAWPAETIISQLSKTAKNGGPVWVLSKP